MLTRDQYRDKVLACWLGKNIGGTLGAPFEWRRQVNDVSFYTQELGGNPLPNDDLDIQLLWLIMLEEQGINLDATVMAEYWQAYVTPYWSEYGNAKINLEQGIQPPHSGMNNNYFKDSCGAFIRSEIWACIAPGNPNLAARYAYEDSSIDHGDGEGMYAAVFSAAIESAAFVITDIDKLIDIGLSYIPEDSGTAQAVRIAQDMYKQGKTWLEARDEVLRQCRGSVFFGSIDYHISKDDVKKGFVDGKMGWDAPSNIGIFILGLLYGEGDFGKTLCITVNCGEDTDCTAATVGSLFGIMYGTKAIPEKWIEPIGRSIKVACLNLGELGYFGDMLPTNIDDLTDRTEKIMQKVAAVHKLPVESLPPTPHHVQENELFADKKTLATVNTIASRHSFTFMDVDLEYLSGTSVAPGASAKLRLNITNKYRAQYGLNIRWYTPDDWKVSPAPELKAYVSASHWPDHVTSIDFELTPTEWASGASARFVIEITRPGRAAVMLVPVHVLVEVPRNSHPRT